MSRQRPLIRVVCLIASAVACGFAPPVRAQAWTEKVRGSWIAGDDDDAKAIVLAKAGEGGEIVVASEEQPCLHQAAKFLATDIERISGYRLPVVAKPTSGRTAILLSSPAGDARWEAY